MKVTVTLPSSLAVRVQRAAEMRGLDVSAYVLAMLQWHAPAYDNDAQFLKSKIAEAVRAAKNEAEALIRVEQLVK